MNSNMNAMEPVLTELIVKNYEGDTLEDESNVLGFGCYHGKGAATFDNGNTYKGEYSFGLFHGVGIFTWADGTVYEGEFHNGQITGKGKYSWSDESVYEGELLNSKRHGKGVLRNSAGQMYDGDWKDGLKHGQGKYWYDEGGNFMYNGDWECGERHGYGILRYSNGNSYEGHWNRDCKHGKGIMIWRDIGEFYTGDWENDVPHGLGEYIWGAFDTTNQRPAWKQHCNLYRGSFINGERDGFGTFFYANGSQYSGQWKSNKKHGEGLLLTNVGNIFYGLFTNDNIDKRNEQLPMNSNISDLFSKETNEVTTQYRLNIDDILLQYIFFDKNSNRAIPGSTTATLDLSKPHDILEYFKIETLECERILLRYHSYLKQHINKMYERSNKHRMKLTGLQYHLQNDNNVLETLPSKISKVMYSARQYHACRIFCPTIEVVELFFTEIGLIDHAILNNHDFKQIVRDMRTSRNQCIKKKRFEYKSQAIDKGLFDQSESSTNASPYAVLPDIVENLFYGNKLSDVNLSDPRHPILEKDLVELMVRCIATRQIRLFSNSKKSFIPLSKVLYKYLADKVQPMLTDHTVVDEFVQAYNHESVQELLHSNNVFLKLKNLWTSKIHSNDSQEPSVGDIVRFFIAGSDITIEQCCNVVGDSVPTNLGKSVFEVDIASKKVDYEDYVFIVCKLLSSDLRQEFSGVENSDINSVNESRPLSPTTTVTEYKGDLRLACASLKQRINMWCQTI